ncbi:MAG: ribosomal-processing cysteine protease Prp [Treponema sp.]|nr:ribosomal-processing cysteine protease Prp [Treponema sp.]
MIRARVALDGAGLLRSCRVEGHAGWGRRGADLVCAAVSVLLRSALRTLSGRKGISLRGAAPDRGLLWMEVDYDAEGRDFLAAAGAFLVDGLRSVAEAYPKCCCITIGGPGPGDSGPPVEG